MKIIYSIFRSFMRRTEEKMISRLLRQRDEAWQEADHYRMLMGLRVGEFVEKDPSNV